MVSETGWLNLIFYHPLSHWQFTKPMQRKTGRNLLVPQAWTVYALAADLTDKDEKVQVATLLTIIGEDAREVYSTFDWENEGDEVKMELVLKKFSDYCEPRKNVPFKRYKFNRREQAAGESYDQHHITQHDSGAANYLLALWNSRYFSDGQWTTILVCRICGFCEVLGISAYHVITHISSIQWES